MEHEKDISEESRPKAQKDEAPRDQTADDQDVGFRFTDWASL